MEPIKSWYISAFATGTLNLTRNAATIHVFTEADTEVLAGRIAIDYLDIGRCQYGGALIYDVCDADSAGWEQVYHAVFENNDGREEVRRDLLIDDEADVFHVAFIHRALFHPVLNPWRSFIVRHIAAMFPNDSILAIWRRDWGLSDRALADLGFRQIAGQPLIYRLNWYESTYDAEADECELTDIIAPPDAAEYVDANWTPA